MSKNENTFAPYDHVVKYFLPLIPKKVKPNHLTFFRLIFSPILIVLFLTEQYLIGLIIFAILAITDMLDGSIARLRNQITDWGKIWDPVADKMLIGIVVASLLLKVNLNLTILLLAFEFAFILAGTFHKITHSGDVQIQANVWGKIKMNLHCLGAGLLMLGLILNMPLLMFIAQIIFYGSLLFAALSMAKRGI